MFRDEWKGVRKERRRNGALRFTKRNLHGLPVFSVAARKLVERCVVNRIIIVYTLELHILQAL